MITVSVAKDFTRYPAGRYKQNGETSGEAFRERFLEGPLRNGESVLVDFDGTVGYGSSFLEEAFGGVVRALKVPSSFVKEHLKFKSADPSICEEVVEYIEEAGRKLG
ncbi:STAS-like domain-containing protein [Variovorax saccharolyticus]|uniref:STAS-like domain-containing protein n=1 Tax=Variovorax saccharolyticus TaxID=3053516 RepID=UPI002578E965|nr:STAS-like domain-containing protein [Variovorax sp. J22R187]MDM0018364.1 STAS-like domain-containing protein [Variovorax sp. J22R187]